MKALLALGLYASTIIGGLAALKTYLQRRKDRQRMCYRLKFPHDVSSQDIANFMSFLGGIHSQRPTLSGSPSVVFEIRADHQGIKHYLYIPAGMPDVVTQVRGHIRANTERLHDMEPVEWQAAVELRMSDPSLSLRINSAEGVASTILNSLHPLKEDEAICYQWIIRPNAPMREHRPAWETPTPRRDTSRKNKAAEHTFLAVGRIAARSTVANKLISRVHRALMSLNNDGISIETKRIPSTKIERRHTRLVQPCVLTASELACVIGWPLSGVGAPGLSTGGSRQLYADSGIPSEGGPVIGDANYPGAERQIVLPPDMSTRHVIYSGASGSGKSWAMIGIALEQMREGLGVGFIDPHGDAIDDILSRIPKGRLKDVILYDPTDAYFPIGLNVFTDPNRAESIANHMMAVINGVFNDSGVMTGNWLRAAFQALASVPGMTMTEVMPFLEDSRFRDSVVVQLSRPLREMWARFDSMPPAKRNEAIEPALRRLQPILTLNESARLSLGQTEGLDMQRVIRENKILLASLPKSMGDTASFIGSLLFTLIWQAATAIPQSERRHFMLYVDEAPTFMHMPVSMETVLAEARKYKLGLSLAHQYLNQFPTSLRAGLHANTATKVIFQVSASDAAEFEREIPGIKRDDLVRQSVYEAVYKSGDFPPTTIKTRPLKKPSVSPYAVRQESRKAWGRPAVEVEREIAARVKGGQTRRVPEIGRRFTDG